jgi:uncharacterized protein YlaI
MNNSQMNVDINQADDMYCAECNSRVFVPAVVLKKLSALLSPAGKETMIPIQVFMCASCHHIPDEFLSAFNG